MQLNKSPYLFKYGAFLAVTVSAEAIQPDGKTFLRGLYGFPFPPYCYGVAGRKLPGKGYQSKAPCHSTHLSGGILRR